MLQYVDERDKWRISLSQRLQRAISAEERPNYTEKLCTHCAAAVIIVCKTLYTLKIVKVLYTVRFCLGVCIKFLSTLSRGELIPASVTTQNKQRTFAEVEGQISDGCLRAFSTLKERIMSWTKSDHKN